MRKAISARWKLLLSAVALVLVTSPALAIPNDDSSGPEGVVSNGGTYFELFVEEDMNHAPIPPAPKDVYDTERFYLADGWDFGDRYAYQCGWVEWFQGQNERFEVHYEMRLDYAQVVGSVQLLDRYGIENEQGESIQPNVLCGLGVSTPGGIQGKGGVPTHDGTDHFPHMIHAGDGIVFYEDGEPLLDAQGDPVFLDLTEAECSKAYYTPGDEPGEAWLWWDEDGPTFSHGEGEGELPCGGGSIDPVAVLRIIVQRADSDIGYCTHSMHEDQCFNVEPPPTPVQLGSGTSVLTCPDSSTPVVTQTDPLLVACP